MSIKDLFGKTSKDLEETVQDVESVKFVEEKSKRQERYLPPVDFSDPKNFVYYGSAELYYDAAIRRIYEDYPYDGSKAEQIEFEEKSSHLERWLFENRYPKTTGYVELGTTGDISLAYWTATNTNEYMRVWGGLHTDESVELKDKFQKSAKYDNGKNRNQNWNCDFENGVTTEFWMKKVDNGLSGIRREVILDLWNGIDPAVPNPEYSRLLIHTQTLGSGTVSLKVWVQVGTTSHFASIVLDSPLEWNHYSISIVKTGPSGASIKFYVNGDLSKDHSISIGFSDSFYGKIDGFIGALQDRDGNLFGATGHGKLSAYLDEFRFWKTERTARQIKLNWFSQVGGGANTDDATSDLGVYFKFNEGIVGNSATDSVVLDYSGRLANGLWVGYPGSSARNTGSAIESVGYNEPATPIIYSNHPEVTALSTEMQTSGSFYDAERGQAFFNSMPTWLQQGDNGNLRQIAQILGSYLDTLHVQIKQMTELKNKDYTPEGLKASTMAQDLLKDKGFLTSNIFGMNEVYEKLSDLDIQDGQFESDLNEIKNIIYTNIYNNLEKIYKSKGTETSIRNFIRCFGIDDELIKLNLYTDGGVQYLSDKSRVTSVKKKYINFNHPDHFSATIYQTSSADNSNTFISGSSTGTNASNNAFTLEADIVVPYKKERGENGYFGTPFLSSSVFGFHHANESDPSDYTWVLQEVGLTAAQGLIGFDLSSFPTGWEGTTVQLTSTDGTVFVYQFDSIETTVANGDPLLNGNIRVVLNLASGPDTMLNFKAAVVSGSKISVTQISVNAFNLDQIVAGESGNTQIITTAPTLGVTDFAGGTSEITDSYDLQVHLVRDSNSSNHAKFILKNELETIYQESDYVYDIYDNEHYNIAIRIKPQTYPYAGGVTNTTPDYDIEMYAVTNNFGEIKEEVLLSQTVDFNTGSTYMNIAKRVYAGSHVENFTGSVLQKSDVEIGSIRGWLDYLDDEEIQNHNKDVLNYGSRRSIDGSSIYTVDNKQIPTHDLTILNWDFDTVLASDSTGQFIVEDTTSGSIDTIYGWVDDVIRREHRARGDFFPNEDSSFLSNEFLYSLKKQLPETAYNSENIFIKGEQEINFSDDDDVSDNLFILEKSPANLVSEEMLKSFSTTMEFANLVGRPIDRYRLEYKDLAKARELFFNKVESDLDFDRFFEYFKWIDSSISSMVNQLIPLSANFAGGIVDVIEPHILERDKYQRQIGLLNTVTSTEASIRGVQELNYNWKFGHAPLSGDEADHCLWQKERKERETPEGEQLRQVFVRQTDQEFASPINLSGSEGIYSGSYAIRRFSKPYSLNIGFKDSIHGGINYDKNKNRNFLSTVITPHGDDGGSGAPKNIMTVGAGNEYGIQSKVDCNDIEDPNRLNKFDGHAEVGKFSSFDNDEPLDDSLHYVYRRKISHVFLGNIISSSVDTGYSSKIVSGFKAGTNVVNLHSDTTDITNEIPLQGPFTEQWVGGHQSRHVFLNKVGRHERFPGELDNQETRPEAWRLLVGQYPTSIDDELQTDPDGALGFTGPDYGGPYPISENLWAIYYREERAKRPVNIKNIQTLLGTGSAGNYVRGYEFLSTFGDQKYFLRRHADENLLPSAIAEALPQTTNYYTLIAQTGSAAGNVFGSETNRWYSNVSDDSPTALFRIHEDSNLAGPPATTPEYFDSSQYIKFTVSRPPGATGTDVVDFAIHAMGDPLQLSGDTTLTLDGDLCTIINTDGVTWSTFAAEIDAAITHPTNGFGSNVSTNITYQPTSAEGEAVLIELVENEVPANGAVQGSINFSVAGGSRIQHVDGIRLSFLGDYYNFNNIVSTQNRSTGSINTIRTIFSAPGGPEINTSGYLDIATQQYSVYNSINFRNLAVRASGSGEQGTIRVNSHSNRREGLRTLRARHQGQFGIDSQHGAVSATDYVAEASFHKQHRNTSKKLKFDIQKPKAIRVPSEEPDAGTDALKTNMTAESEIDLVADSYVSFSFWFKAEDSTDGSRALFGNLILGPSQTGINFEVQSAGGNIIAVNFSVQDTNSNYRFNLLSFSSPSVPIDQWNQFIISLELDGTYSFANSKVTINGVENDSITEGPSVFTGDIKFGRFLSIGETVKFFSDGPNQMVGSLMNFGYYDSFIHNNPSDIEIIENHTDGSEIGNITSLKAFWFLGNEFEESIGEPVPEPVTVNSSYGKTPLTLTTILGGDEIMVLARGFYYERESLVRASVFDNDNFTSLLPSSDFQYSWINSAISGSNWEDQQKVLDFAPSSGLISSSVGITEAIVFPTISDIRCGGGEYAIEEEGAESAQAFDMQFKVLFEDANGQTQEVVATLDDPYKEKQLKILTTIDDSTNPDSEILASNIENIETSNIYSGGSCNSNDLDYRLIVVDPSTSLVGTPVRYLGWYNTNFRPGSDPAVVPSAEGLGSSNLLHYDFYHQDCNGENGMQIRLIFDSCAEQPSIDLGVDYINKDGATITTNNQNGRTTISVVPTALYPGGEMIASDVHLMSLNVLGYTQGCCPSDVLSYELTVTPSDDFQDILYYSDPQTDPTDLSLTTGISQDWLDDGHYGLRYSFSAEDTCGTLATYNIFLEICKETTLYHTVQFPSQGDTNNFIEITENDSPATIFVKPYADGPWDDPYQMLESQVGTHLFSSAVHYFNGEQYYGSDGCCDGVDIQHRLRVYEQDGVTELDTSFNAPSSTAPKRAIQETDPIGMQYWFIAQDCAGNASTIKVNLIRCFVFEVTLSVTYLDETSTGSVEQTIVNTSNGSVWQLERTIQLLDVGDSANDNGNDMFATNVSAMQIGATSSCCPDILYSLKIYNEINTLVLSNLDSPSPPSIPSVDYDAKPGAHLRIVITAETAYDDGDCADEGTQIEITLLNAKLAP